MVSVGGFEPPISCFQGRQGRPGSPTRRELEHTAGLEPAPPWSATRRFVRLSYVCAIGAAAENSGLPVESRRVLATRRSRPIGSPTRIRTWIDRLTAGRPTVGRSGNGAAPRTRTELNLLAREISRTLRVPQLGLPRGARPFGSACTERWREGSDPAHGVVPGVGFEGPPLRGFNAALSPD
jgi:hypothetical protein